MPTLSKELRRTLENVVADARRIAEAGAEQVLKQLAVHHSESWPTMTTEEKALREKLRAHGKQLGDKREANRTQEIPRLKQACAYEHWHRMLFARFLAENNLLIHPDFGEPISLDEIKELAREQNADWLSIAASFAQRMLIEVFRPDDPVLDLILPPETRQKLEEKLAALTTEVFTAEDSLGWVYQFWQRDEKDAVNKSEVKIGADELASVTQLFTEDYMVLFLLHNTLGAWWTSKRQAEGLASALAGYEWTYLRLNEDGTPAAGSYDSWPRAARDLRLLDPCMGSGHFLIFALPILTRMRVVEEGLTLSAAVVATLRENISGLELDARCSQIAAFNLALTAWRLVGAHCALPEMNLACSGLGINASETDWVELAGEDGRAREEMRRLYSLFRDAPVLGSLIDPCRLQANVYASGAVSVFPLLEEALRKEELTDETKELVIAAQGVMAAFRILASQFTLVATNVPYLGRGKQDTVLAKYCEEFHADAKADLATCFVDRCLRFCGAGGSVALVTPQNWLFLGVFKHLRKRLLAEKTWNILARLGPAAFQDMNWWAATTLLSCLTSSMPSVGTMYSSVDASGTRDTSEKPNHLLRSAIKIVLQSTQLQNPDSAVIDSAIDSSRLLKAFANCNQGIGTADSNRYIVRHWELPQVLPDWEPYQMAPESSILISGCHSLLRWENGVGSLCKSSSARICGQPAWNKLGVAISVTGALYQSLYLGYRFDCTLAAITAKDERYSSGVTLFGLSPDFPAAVRGVDQALSVTESSFLKVAFDAEHWQQTATEMNPEGIRPLHSDDPTQWLFKGYPKNSDYPLQVAVARMVGYRWPRQTGSALHDLPVLESDGLEAYAESDGIVCLGSLAGEPPAADRLRVLLEHTYGPDWSASKLSQLLGEYDSPETWLRDRFFSEHCELFHNRPFVWHIWDGRKDGFHALVNYHKLAAPNGEGRKTLEKLIYTALGDWIARQRSEVAASVDGADGRLAAAQHLQAELEKILAGENPYDIFARWKPIHEQPVGWEPDLNDGVRLNIRPWLKAQPFQPTRKDASVLRATPSIKYGKDRGKEPPCDKTDFPWFADSTDRDNDIHLTLDEKRAARERRKK